jgi:hypothetical protein
MKIMEKTAPNSHDLAYLYQRGVRPTAGLGLEEDPERGREGDPGSLPPRQAGLRHRRGAEPPEDRHRYRTPVDGREGLPRSSPRRGPTMGAAPTASCGPTRRRTVLVPRSCQTPGGVRAAGSPDGPDKTDSPRRQGRASVVVRAGLGDGNANSGGTPATVHDREAANATPQLRYEG